MSAADAADRDHSFMELRSMTGWPGKTSSIQFVVVGHIYFFQFVFSFVQFVTADVIIAPLAQVRNLDDRQNEFSP